MNQDINYWIARCASLEQELDMMKEQSIIHWQTGEPKESGSYLVFIKGEFSDYTTCAMYNTVTGWCHWKKEEITAWCKLRGIKPFKEGTK